MAEVTGETIELTQSDLTEALGDWVDKKFGKGASVRISVQRDVTLPPRRGIAREQLQSWRAMLAKLDLCNVESREFVEQIERDLSRVVDAFEAAVHALDEMLDGHADCGCRVCRASREARGRILDVEAIAGRSG